MVRYQQMDSQKLEKARKALAKFESDIDSTRTGKGSVVDY